MRPPVITAAYACLYPGLAEIAQSHGYALTLHGSMARDLDFVAIPWTEDAAPAETLVKAIKEHVGAICLWEEINQRHPDCHCTGVQNKDPELKPHGRLAWMLLLHAGASIDLSVMPRQTTAPS